MHIDDMKIFCDVVRHHSFSRGAAENRVTQSSVSQMIQKMEEHLDVVLIDRSRRPWKLTAEGKSFFDGCLDIVEQYRRLEQEVRHKHAKTQSVIRVAAIYSVGLGPMNRYVSRFMELHPDTCVVLEYLHPDCVYRRVLDAAADLGIVSFPQRRRELKILPWRDEPMVVSCSPSHRLARDRAVLPSRLNGEAFVGFDRGLVIRRKVDQFLKRHRVAVSVRFEFDNVEAIKRAVEVGSGISILPRPTLDREVEMGTLRALPFAVQQLKRPLGILCRRKELSPAVSQFMEMLQGPLPDLLPRRRVASNG
jgi:DNA-binding transcriptional LysR family regulator